MKFEKLLVLFFFTFLISCNRDNKIENPISWNFEKDVKKILPDGFYRAIILNGMDLPEEIRVLSQIMKDSLKRKEKWYIGFLKENPDSIPYHPYFGISKADFEKIQSSKKRAALSATGTESLMIRSNKNEIRFEGSGYLSVLSDSRIDISKKIFYFKGEKIPLRDTTNCRDSLNPLRDTYSSYEFKIKGQRDSVFYSYKFALSWMNKKQSPCLTLAVRETSPNRIIENYTLLFTITSLK